MQNKEKQKIKFKEWLISKGLEPNNSIYNEYFLIFLKEIGWSSGAINHMDNYRNDLLVKEKKAEKTFKNLERYIPVTINTLVVILNYFFGFLSNYWHAILFIALGVEILVIFIQNTIKKAIIDSKEN